MDLTTCPECGEIAEVQWRAVLESTDGPVEHSKVLCMNRHWFLLPTASLERPSGAARPEPGRARPAPARPRNP